MATVTDYKVTMTGNWVQLPVWAQWGGWTTTSNTTSYTLQDLTWTTWTGTGISTGTWIINNNYTQNNVWQTWHETEVERQAREDREQQERERRSRERLAAQRRLEGAQDRALELLEMILTPQERLMRANTGVVTVRGNAGGLYEVALDYMNDGYGSVHGNIKAVDEHGCVLGRLCVAPAMYDREEHAALPLADGWVGQILGLKFNETEFVAKANWSGRRTCQAPDVPVLRAA